MFELRMKLMKLCIIYIGGIGLFCLISPVFGYPLDFPKETIVIIKQVLPLFIGFLTVGARYFTQTNIQRPAETVSKKNIGAINSIVNWSFWLFTILIIALFSAFGYSGSRWAQHGHGMSIDDFTLILTIILSIVTGTVGTIVTFAFAQENGK